MKYLIGAILGWFAHLHYGYEITTTLTAVYTKLTGVLQ